MTLKTTLAKVASFAVATSLVVGVASFGATANAAAMTAAQVQSIISLLQSFGADAATIANVQASLTGSAPSVPSTPSAPSSCSFTRDLTLGATGADVTALQQGLIANGYAIAAGATGYFGAQTQAAVMAWQKAAGITPAAGYFGPKSRAAFPCSSTGPSTGPNPAPVGTGLSVMAGAPIQNALAPNGATRVPFTNFKVTAGSDGDVVINSVTVQRTGLGQDAAFAGVVLVNLDTGEQIGNAKTFNSNHQANVGATMTVKAGQTVNLQIAGNMNSSLGSYAGEAPALSVVGVNTTAAVSGALPITGAYHTINATLTVGTLSLDTSSAFASNSTVSKEIGTVAHRVSGFRLTAGSSEDVRVKMIRWNQTGSVSAGDLANVMTYVGGTAYPAVISADGKYYTTSLGSGVVIPKGNQVEVYASYDIVGSNASGRTIIFDVDKTTDIFATGETYGYGISPSTSGGSSVPSTRGNTTETTGTPYIYANQTTVTGASVTTIAKANEVPAQNVAINVPNQPLGGYVVDLKGEAMTVQSQVFHFNFSTGAASSNLFTNVTLVDQNGAVVAGPVDAVNVVGTEQKVTFTDSVTYKTGKGVYTLRGKIPSTATGGVTIIASTTPSSDWTNARGETSGNTISLSGFSGQVAMNTMTIKAGTITVGRATSPASQTLTPGGSSVLMVNFQYDASQSGEDVRFSTIPATLTYTGGGPGNLSACAPFDGTTQLSTGSNTVNPSGGTGATNTFTLDNPFTVTKGTVKTVGIRCNISGSATSSATYAWDAGAASAYSFSGATSGTTITGTDSTDATITITIGAGALAISTDASNPSYKLAAANTANSTNLVAKLRATNEDVSLTKIGLKLTNTASSSISDLVKVTIWDGATKVGEATFSDTGGLATSTLTTPLTLTKNVDKILTVKADYANIGVGDPITFSGHLVAIDIVDAEGVGAQSGTTISSTYVTPATALTASNGTRVFKSFPTIALDSTVNGTTGLADGRLMRFKVTADAAGPVGITQFAINLATSTATVNNINIYGYEDSGFSTPVSGVSTDGSLKAAAVSLSGVAAPDVTIPVQTSGGTASVIQVPAGATRYFEVKASTVTGNATGASVTTKLLGSSSFTTGAVSSASTNPTVNAAAHASTAFVWSPNSTSTSVRADQDWVNGFGVTGLPASGLITSRSY